MDNRSRYTEPAAEPRGISGDLHRLRTHGGASAAEIRDFVGRLHGKSPQEVLGAVTGSNLVRCMTLSTVTFALLLAAFTVVPWMLNNGDGEKQAAAAGSPQPSAAPPGATPAGQSPANSAETTTAAAPAGDTETALSPEQKTVDALGIGETKTADPKANPLDKNLDNLLDGID